MHVSEITALMPLKSFHPDFVHQAINSLMQQTSPQWVLKIIVENRDLSMFEKLLTQALRDERIHILVNRGRKLAGAINTGMHAAETDFVAILLADDMWVPPAVEVLNHAITHYPEADFFHSSRRYIDENGAFISSVYRCCETVTLADFILKAPVKHLLCWRRSLALRFGGLDESLNSVGPDDFDFPWSMVENGAAFQSVPECLYHYREHDKCFRLTTGLPLSVHNQQIRRILQKHGLSEDEIVARIEAAQQSYLKRCIYKTHIDRWVDKLLGGRRRQTYRPTYT